MTSADPPVIKCSFCLQASELISETLVHILNGESKEKFSAIDPLTLGLSVFLVTKKCDINLGVKGWADLCLLVSSEAVVCKKNLDGLHSFFQQPQL